jgi:hypothetical protein
MISLDVSNAISTDANRLPSVLHEWFIEMFPETESWFTARLRYTRSAAVMSMVGYVLGYVTLGRGGNCKNFPMPRTWSLSNLLYSSFSSIDSATGMVRICCLKKEQAAFSTLISTVSSTRYDYNEPYPRIVIILISTGPNLRKTRGGSIPPDP